MRSTILILSTHHKHKPLLENVRSFSEQAVQDLFGGGVRLLGVIALLAAWNAVSTCRSAAARNGNHMIHREILRAYVLVAVMAHALCKLCAPPVRGTQIPRPSAFALHVHGICIYVQPVFSHKAGNLPVVPHQRSTRAPPPPTSFSTSALVAMDVSPGVVMASAPCDAP